MRTSAITAPISALTSLPAMSARSVSVSATRLARSALQPSQRLAVRREDGTELGTSLVRSNSPTAVPLPERLWRDPRQEEWGHELVLAATGNERPGERLHLSPAR